MGTLFKGMEDFPFVLRAIVARNGPSPVSPSTSTNLSSDNDWVGMLLHNECDLYTDRATEVTESLPSQLGQ
jgi:hypothetical protein